MALMNTQMCYNKYFYLNIQGDSALIIERNNCWSSGIIKNVVYLA